MLLADNIDGYQRMFVKMDKGETRTTSTPSKPAEIAHLAAWTWSSIASLMSWRVMGWGVSQGTAVPKPLGVRRFAKSCFVADGPSGWRPPRLTETVARPVWREMSLSL